MLAVFGLLLWGVDRAPRQPHGDGWGVSTPSASPGARAGAGVSRRHHDDGRTRGRHEPRLLGAFLVPARTPISRSRHRARRLPHDVPGTTLAVGMITAAAVGLLSHLGSSTGSAVRLRPFCAYRVALAAHPRPAGLRDARESLLRITSFSASRLQRVRSFLVILSAK
jgi:hypothetical protein